MTLTDKELRVKNVWDNSHLLEELETLRQSKKDIDGKFQTFDCFNLLSMRNKAYCRHGQRLNDSTKDGSVLLTQVLKGSLFTVCKKCSLKEVEDYEL